MERSGGLEMLRGTTGRSKHASTIVEQGAEVKWEIKIHV